MGFVDEDIFPNQTINLSVQLAFRPDGSKLVAGKDGAIWTVTAAGVKLLASFIDLSAGVLSNDDRGLPGVAIDPDFASNRRVYMLCAVDPDSDGVETNIPALGQLERYATSAANPAAADLSTRRLLTGSGDGGNADITDAGGTNPSFGPGLIDPPGRSGAAPARTGPTRRTRTPWPAPTPPRWS